MSFLLRAFGRTRTMAVAILIVIIAAPSAWALDPDRQLKQLHHTAWTIREGLPFAGVRAVAQTPDGFLWLASYIGGLHRFDGVKAEPVAVEPLRGRLISDLITDARGDLWIGFNSLEIARLTSSGLEFFDVPATSAAGAIFSMAPDLDGSIWVATRDKVYHFDGKRWQIIDDPWPFTSPAFSDPGGVWAFAVAADGTVWSKNLLGLHVLRRGAKAFEQAPGYAGGMFDFAKDAHGRLWTSDFSSRRFYRLPDLIPGQPVPPPQLGAVVPEFMSGVLRIDRNGTLWNANRVTGFLYRANSLDSPGTPDRFTTDDGLTAEFPTSIFEDREGNIWIPTNLGLDRFRNVAIASEPDVPIRPQAAAIVATPEAVFVYSGMRALLPDPDGEPGGHLIRIRPRQRPEIIDNNIGQLTGIAAAPDGSIVFSREGKLFRWREGVSTPIVTPPELDGGHVVNLAATTDGIVVSFYQKGVHRLSGSTWVDITAPGAKPQDTASVAVDAAGAAWLLYWGNGRMLRVGPKGTEEFRSPVGDIQAGFPDRDGMIFVGNNGLARFDGRTLQSISAARASILTLAYGIARSDDDGVWIGCRGGILRIDRAVLLNAFARSDAPLKYQLYDVNDGYTGTFPVEMYDAQFTRGPDGRIWTFMRTGLGWIDPKRQYRNSEPPPILITAVSAQRRRYDMPRALSLPAGTSQIEIDYSAPSLAIPERVRFRYKLDGVDEDWIDAGSRRQAFYTSLPPGEHRFRVTAAIGDGVWNEQGASLTFTIAPTFLQSIWFKLLLAIVTAGLIWLIYRVLLGQQAARLHKRFEIRIAERERIARELHDTLLQSVQGLILRFDSVARRVSNDIEAYASAQEAIGRAEVVVAEGRDRVRELRTRSKADLGRSIVEVSREIIHGDLPQLALKEEGVPHALHAVVRDEMVLIASEAMRNAVQHARANTLEIVLDYGEAELRMLVQDDGSGIPGEVLTKGHKSGHYGLIGMRERAQRIGGRLRIYGREGGGTAVAVAVPARAAYSDWQGFLKRILYPGERSNE